MKRFFSLLLTTLLLLLPLQLAADDDCSSGPESHWAGVAASSHASGKPIMVVFSSDACGYCSRLKSELIRPMLDDGALQQQVVIREFNIDRLENIEDFDGLPVRSRTFVSRYKIFATPTVILLDASGKPIGNPIVGYDNSEDYRNRLRGMIEEAQRTLALAAL